MQEVAYVPPFRDDVVIERRKDVWRGDDGEHHCKHRDGTTGLVIAAAGGAFLGREIDRVVCAAAKPRGGQRPLAPAGSDENEFAGANGSSPKTDVMLFWGPWRTQRPGRLRFA